MDAEGRILNFTILNILFRYSGCTIEPHYRRGYFQDNLIRTNFKLMILRENEVWGNSSRHLSSCQINLRFLNEEGHYFFNSVEADNESGHDFTHQSV